MNRYLWFRKADSPKESSLLFLPRGPALMEFCSWYFRRLYEVCFSFPSGSACPSCGADLSGKLIFVDYSSLGEDFAIGTIAEFMRGFPIVFRCPSCKVHLKSPATRCPYLFPKITVYDLGSPENSFKDLAESEVRQPW